jgi:hypothetical protein|tara:strand:- start:395 stop:826 length:432 start_codon:yes stop_codon:yes gene_type:complete
MVEMRNNPQQEQGTTPATITVSMILEDLDNGIDRTGIKVKYDLQAWEVKQMFDHPSLKGKKAKRVKKLSFNFIDDTNPDVLPGQVDLIEAIDEEMKGRQMMDAQDQIQEFGTSEQVSEIEHESVIRETIDLEDRADTYNEQDY